MSIYKKLFFRQEYILATGTAQEYLQDIDSLIEFLKCRKNEHINRDIGRRIESINDYDYVFITVSQKILNSNEAQKVFDKRLELFSVLILEEHCADLKREFICSLIKQIDFDNLKHRQILTYLITHREHETLFLTPMKVRIFFRHILLSNNRNASKELEKKITTIFFNYLFKNIKPEIFNNFLCDTAILAPLFNLDTQIYDNYKKWGNIYLTQAQYSNFVSDLCYNIKGRKFLPSRVLKWQRHEKITAKDLQNCFTEDNEFNKKNRLLINNFIANTEKKQLNKVLKETISKNKTHKL